MNNIFDRTVQLIGNKNFEQLSSMRVAVFGLGGVGGTALECLARSGIRHFVLVDFDTVSESNLNRQLLFNSDSIGKAKTECAFERIKSINKDVEVITINKKVNDTFFNDFLINDIDYVVDAIDDVNGKLEIAKYCHEKNIPLIASLGMGNRLDPSKVVLTTLDKTENDPLARKVRSIFRKNSLDLHEISVVLSTETPITTKVPPASMMMVPSSAGLLIGFKVICDAVKSNKFVGGE